MITQDVTVHRILTYTGPRETLDAVMSQSAVPLDGSRVLGKVKISSKVIGAVEAATRHIWHAEGV